MTATASIEIKGMEEVVAKLKKLGQFNRLSPAIKASAAHVKGKIAQYPPSTEANQPRGFNSVYSISSKRAMNMWYERGYGAKWVIKNGMTRGNKTSEMLGRKWTIKMVDGGTGAVVGNNVSYGPYVQGEQQAYFHKARGWKTTAQVADEEAETVNRFIQAEINKILAGG